MQAPQSLHKYAYVHNNPVNGVDPSGNFFIGTAIGLVSSMAISLFVRSRDALVNYAKYKAARRAITAISVASVIASSFVSKYVDGSIGIDLPFGDHPNLKKWPHVEFSLNKESLEVDVRYKDKGAYTGPGPGGNINIGFKFKYVFETGKLEGFAGSVGMSVTIYKEGPISASIGGKYVLPPAFKIGLGLSFSSGWEYASWDTSFSILKADKNGIDVLWGTVCDFTK